MNTFNIHKYNSFSKLITILKIIDAVLKVNNFGTKALGRF